MAVWQLSFMFLESGHTQATIVQSLIVIARRSKSFLCIHGRSDSNLQVGHIHHIAKYPSITMQRQGRYSRPRRAPRPTNSSPIEPHKSLHFTSSRLRLSSSQLSTTPANLRAALAERAWGLEARPVAEFLGRVKTRTQARELSRFDRKPR